MYRGTLLISGNFNEKPPSPIRINRKALCITFQVGIFKFKHRGLEVFHFSMEISTK